MSEHGSDSPVGDYDELPDCECECGCELPNDFDVSFEYPEVVEIKLELPPPFPNDSICQASIIYEQDDKDGPDPPTRCLFPATHDVTFQGQKARVCGRCAGMLLGMVTA